MAQIREIKKRMVAVRNIERITKTMQMIATAKFTSSLQRAQATKPYAKKVQQLVAEVSAAAGDVSHPLIDGPSKPTGRELVLVIASDRGLCGAYNGGVLRKALKHLRGLQDAGTGFNLEIAGKKAAGFFKFQRMEVEHRHEIGDSPKFEAIDEIASRFIEAFTNGEIDAVRVVYTRYESNARQIPEVLTLLPLKPVATDALSGGAALYEFTPSSGELLEDLLPRSVKTALFQAFNDGAVSEQIMRMIAMKSATENARDLSKSLGRDFNRARQTKITTELMEVISGAAALE